MIAYKHYPQVEQLCTMIKSSDVVYKGRRICTLEYAGNDHIKLVPFEGSPFHLTKIMVNIDDFKPFR